MDTYGLKHYYIDQTDQFDVNKRGNSLEKYFIELEKIESSPSGNDSIATLAFDGTIDRKSTFFKVDHAQITSVINGKREFDDYINGLVQVQNQNSAITNSCISVNQKNIMELELENQARVTYDSKNKNFNGLDQKLISREKISIATSYLNYKREWSINFNSVTRRLNNPMNILNPYAEKSDNIGSHSRVSISEIGKRTTSNPRVITDIANNPAYYQYSTTADLIKIGILARNHKMAIMASSAAKMVPNRRFIFSRSITVVQIDKNTFLSAVATDAETVALFDDSKDTKAVVLLANLILNTEVPLTCNIYQMANDYLYYPNRVNVGACQRYKKAIIYSANPSLVDALIQTVTNSDYDEEAVLDISNYLNRYTSNHQDVYFADQVISNLKSFETLEEKGIRYSIPEQSYPLPIGFVSSVNPIRLNVFSDSEVKTLIYDHMVSKTFNPFVSTYLSIKCKTLIQEQLNGDLFGQEQNYLDNMIKKMSNNIFALWSRIANVPFYAYNDNFVDKSFLDVDLFNEWSLKKARTGGKDENRYYSYQLIGPETQLGNWILLKEVPGFSVTQTKNLGVSAERFKNRTLVTHYDLDGMFDDLNSGFCSLKKFEFDIPTQNMTNRIGNKALDFISKNNGILIKLEWKRLSIVNVDKNSFVPRSEGFGRSNSVMNSNIAIHINDPVRVEQVLDELKQKIRDGGAGYMLNANTSNWLRQQANDIVRYNIKYYSQYDATSDTWYLTFIGIDAKIVSRLNTAFKSIKLTGVSSIELTKDKKDIDTEQEENEIMTDIQGGTFELDGIDLINEVVFENDIVEYDLKPHQSIKLEKDLKLLSIAKNEKLQKLSKIYDKSLLDEIILKNVEPIPIVNKLEDGNCVYDSVTTVLSTKDKNKFDLQLDITKHLIYKLSGERTANSLKFKDVVNFFKQRNASVKLIHVNDDDGVVRLISFGRVLNRKFIIFRRSNEGMYHAQPYKIKDVRAFENRLWGIIVKLDIFGIGVRNYENKENVDLSKLLMKYVYLNINNCKNNEWKGEINFQNIKPGSVN